MNASTIPTDVRLAIVAFAAANGRTWKAKLVRAWESGENLGMALQAARNVVGPTGLYKGTWDVSPVAETPVGTFTQNDAPKPMDVHDAKESDGYDDIKPISGGSPEASPVSTLITPSQTIANLFTVTGVSRRSLRQARNIIARSFPVGSNVVTMDNVPQRDGTKANLDPYRVGSILSDGSTNRKLSLSDEAQDQFLTFGVSLAPAKENGLATLSGHRVNLCSHASDGCRSICLMDTGYARVAPNVRIARIAKSRLWVTNPELFKCQLMVEIARASISAEKIGKRLMVRLNVFSDVIWERKFPELFGAFPNVQFYDYTKVPSRMGKTPSNYHLTFSRSETNHDVAVSMLESGHNVAVVFEDHTFPPTFHGFPTIDGTAHDMRPLDPHNVVVALAEKDTEMHGPRYQGKRNTAINTRGFVLPTTTSNAHGQTIPQS